MNKGISEVMEMAHRYLYVLSDFGNDETVYFNLIVAHAGLLKFAREEELPSGLRNLILEVAAVLRDFLSQSALSSVDLAIIRDSIGQILHWSEEELKIVERKQFHLNREGVVHA